MVRIGNWKKQPVKSTSMKSWKNKKSDSFLFIYRENYKDDKFNKSKEKWKIELIKGSSQEKIILKEFETKKPAIDFLENWMEENQFL